MGDSLTRVSFWSLRNVIAGREVSTHFAGYWCSYNHSEPDLAVRFGWRCAWTSVFHPGFGTVSAPYTQLRNASLGVEWLPPWFGVGDALFRNRLYGDVMPDVLVVGNGAHDMHLNDLFAFRANVNEFFRKLRMEFHYTGRIVWLGGTAAVAEKIATWLKHYMYVQTQERSRRYMQVVRGAYTKSRSNRKENE